VGRLVAPEPSVPVAPEPRPISSVRRGNGPAPSNHREREATLAAPSSIATTSAVAPMPAPVIATAPSRTLSEEIALVDAARAALAHGDATTALVDLHRHDVDFPAGALTLDVGLLRVRALFLAGQSADARREAARLLATNPSGPYAARVRELLGHANP